MIQTSMQIGKNGLTEGILQVLKNSFKTHDIVKISVLKSGREKEKVEEMAEEIVDELGKKYTAKIIGFTIIVRKWRKEQAQK
ncbi:hypothetical protein FJZ19_00515 [Candidatus Pacearchaeota archaeon]|nr:hypothetical protein [Candidatus Pacearchaeota archaeon]